jgi:hypothetical protein
LPAGRRIGFVRSLPSSAIKEAAAAEQKEQNENQDDQLRVVHDRSLSMVE